MHVFVTIPLNKQDVSVPQRTRGLVTDLFASGPTAWPGAFYFVRTWDRETSLDSFQLSLESTEFSADEARDRVERAATTHGLHATVAEVPFEEIPSPLWNCGFGGPDFDSVAKRLFRAASPVLARIAASLDGDTTGSYLLALRLMVAHAGATLLESEQRQLPSHSFEELLSLRLLSFRSHYEGVFARASDPESFERRYAAYYDQLGARARDYVRACAQSPESAVADARVSDWAGLVHQHFTALREAVASGAVVDEGLTLDDLNRGREVPLPPTRFHSFMSDEMAQLLHHNPDFLSFRVLTSLLYSSLHTLGFNLVERYLFCYVLARANEDVSGRATAELQSGLGALARKLAHR
ncbi:hypothetical protein N4G70_12005 [Streptomyces sp. ASQP_92]|uniref:hypothetical protein n=1 Tax=Streptomyces sp. ASQP_92 TaxID=2979116 RepID=UPI0021C14BB4|nr:hypothetical protein [Streptomyces sp. ASQP_92]MCT9089595.1 hypothetical protein [Streptomyces sp. ASQP_92]